MEADFPRRDTAKTAFLEGMALYPNESCLSTLNQPFLGSHRGTLGDSLLSRAE